MKEKFDDYLINGLNDYDKEYLPTMDYVMLLLHKNGIKGYFARKTYMAFVEYPTENYEYNNAYEVLESEITLCKCKAGIIYKKAEDGSFKDIAFIDLTNKKDYTL